MAVDLKEMVREVPDFPTPGISFKDIMPLLRDADALRETVDQLAGWAAERDPDMVVGGEARGLLIHDDVLATGGTARAMAQLVEQLGGTVVGYAFIIELGFLDGRKQLEGFDIYSLIQYP